MEDQIITGKRFELEKLKDCPLRIPVTFKVTNSKISVKIISEMDHSPLTLEFIFADSLAEVKSNNIILPFDVNQTETIFYPKNHGIFEINKNYMLLSLKASKRITIEVSISIV